jgi:hypothetical protein
MMYKKLILVLLVIAGCKNPPTFSEIKITEIKVLDSAFNILNTIKDTIKINELKSLIGDLDDINNATINHKWNYKLDILSDNYSGRWLYDTLGILTRLDYQLKPSYRIQDSHKFTNLLLQK